MVTVADITLSTPPAPRAFADDAPSAHMPAMVAEVLAHLTHRAGGVTVDGTLGGGGHAERILAALPADNIYMGLDRDPAALARARRRLAPFGARVSFVHADFRALDAAAAPYAGRVTNVLLDLGLSSDQLAAGDRGFAFALDGPLDMRFDPTADIPTAADIVNSWPEKRLADALFAYGEERKARAIARAIVNARARGPLATTRELAALVARAVGGGRHRIHPATRTFQALRVVVNDELSALTAALSAAVSISAAGAALIVISYHSLEDGIVKRFFRDGGRAGTLTVRTPKPLRPAGDEVRANPRARSARLRAALKN